MGLFDRLIGKQEKNILAHVLDLNSGYTIQEWTIGKDVAVDDVRRYADGGELYVIKPAKVGQKPAGFVTREVWKSASAEFNEKDNEFLSRPRFYTGDPAKDLQYNYGPSSSQPQTAQSNRKEIGEKLFIQAIGSQSDWHETVFKKALELADAEINALEITYFTLSLLQVAYLNFGSGEDEEKMDLLAEVSAGVVYQSAKSSNIDLETVIPTYHARFKEYYRPILELMRFKDDPDVLDMLLSVFRHVTDREPNGGDTVMLAFYSSRVHQTVVDHVKFVKESLN